MRLKVLDRRPPLIRLWSAFVGLFGVETPDLANVLFYRPRFFGRPWGRALQSIMRGRSEWTPGQRELFAAYVSVLNQCPF